MNYYRYLILAVGLIGLLALPQRLQANAAQPGIWNAGGTVFTLLYPEDAHTFKKVQMQQERIYIQLYKGFAVVKGTYVFKNTTSQVLTFKMGYPVNGIYAGGQADLNEVIIDSLSHFKIKARQQWLPLRKENHSALHNDQAKTIPFSDNWMVWEMAFAPNEIQVVEVYFIVNTNDARVRRGYNSEKRNAFIYLLESGSVWRQPIEKGFFYVQLKDGLGFENLQGISEGFDFKFNDQYQLFAGSKINFSPTPQDNLVAAYFEHIENFNFKQSTAQSVNLYKSVDTLSQLPLTTLSYKTVALGNPYKVSNTFTGALPGLLTLFVLAAPFIVAGVFLVILIWAFIRWRKIRNKQGF